MILLLSSFFDDLAGPRMPPRTARVDPNLLVYRQIFCLGGPPCSPGVEGIRIGVGSWKE